MKQLVAAMSLAVLLSPSPRLQRESKAAIEGVVFRASSSDPVVGAQVTLGRVSTGPLGASAIPGVTSDAQGRFSFTNLDPGTYRLLIARAGYVRQEYGQRSERVPGAPIVVAAGPTIKDLMVRMTPTGNISGRVVNTDRHPVAAIPVQLLRAAYTADGKRTFQAVQSAITDDRGDYRMYWITPGRYYLNAADSNTRPGGVVGQSMRRDASLPVTYYPGVTDPDAAGIVEVSPDGEMNASFVLPSQELHSIRGRLIDTTTGRWPADARLNLVTGQVGTGNSNGYNPLNGTFEIRDVAPGSYAVTASLPTGSAARLPGGTPGPPPTSPGVFAMAQVTVGGSDVEGVVLNLASSISLSGRLRIEGAALSAVPGIDRLRVRMDTTLLGGRSGMSGPIGEDGSFTIEGLMPGEYRQSMWSLPANFFVKGSRIDASSVMNEPFQIQGPGSYMEIVLNPNAGQIEGTVTDELLKPVGGVFVVLVPDQRRDRADLYRNLNSDDRGQFTMRGVPPGSYKAFAFEFLEEYGYFEPGFFNQIEHLGAPVRTAESSRETLNLKLIPNSGR